ncbi:MAG: RNB domain-containing ribonuclease [Bacilli bacterium]|nr:RNB domain-containing ribonuclease [Bacilli bacterium]
MKNIEKSLVNFVKGKGPMISEEAFCNHATKDANGTIDILFKVINNELDLVTGLESLERVRELLKCINVLLSTNDKIDRKKLARKINKLDEKIDQIELENKNKFHDVKNAINELEAVREELDGIDEQTIVKDTKQYDLINYLVAEKKDITYIEYTFNKMPSLVNAKDKEDVSLFRNIVKNYIKSIKDEDYEKSLYFSNLISLIMSQRSFSLNENEKRKTLSLIYSSIDRLSVKKSYAKKNKDKIEWLTSLIDTIKGEETKDTRIELLANKYNVSVYFNEDILEKARLVKITDRDKSTRMLVDDYIITIDGDNAVEIDDALSCRRLANGNYLLGVHIASVLGYFSYHDEIVNEAIGRGRSIYLSNKYQTNENDYNRTIPLFPYEFSAKTGSLITGMPKLARSYFFEIDSTGNIVDETFQKTIICSNRQTTYREIDKILKHGTKDKELQDLVFNLQSVTELLDKRYKDKGDQFYENIKASTTDPADLRVQRIGSERIVYQAMLLTGNRVADFFADRDYPCLYRVHSVNQKDSKKLQTLIDNLTKTYGGDQYNKLYQLIEGIYPKGWYDIEGSHDGLGLDHYCHCTSALRRAADIVVEHALEVCYDVDPKDKDLVKLEEEISKRKSEINNKQNPIDWFTKDYKRAYQKRR